MSRGEALKNKKCAVKGCSPGAFWKTKKQNKRETRQMRGARARAVLCLNSITQAAAKVKYFLKRRLKKCTEEKQAQKKSAPG